MADEPPTPYGPDDLLESVVRITELRDRDNLGLSLARTLHELIGGQHVTLYRQLTDHAGRALLQPTATAGIGMEMPDAAECPGCLALSDHPHHARCVQQDASLALADGTRLFPVHGSGDAVIGLLEIGGKALAAWDEHLVSGFLRIFRNYLSLLEDSERDTLTGLLNRKTFDRNIARILARKISDVPAIGPAPERRHIPPGEACHWLAVMDVDHFKRINDRFGHLYGDEVLLLLARQMMETFRHHDRLYRFGGEEFVILLEPTDRDNARKVLERFRARVETYPFPQVGRVTVSIGFARITPLDAPSNVIGHADQALYHAKHHGRNQVCSYEHLLETGNLGITQVSGEAVLF